MMTFASLPHPLKSGLLTLLFITVCIAIYFLPYPYRRKNRLLMVLHPLSVLISGSMLVLYDAHVKCYKPGWTRYEPVERFAELPLLHTLPFFLFAIAVLSVIIYREKQHRRSSITRSSIKESLDHLPTGLCFTYPNGRIMLMNHRMDELCHILTGAALQNGNDLWADLCTGHTSLHTECVSTGAHPAFRLPDGSVWTFSREYIDDITQYTAADTTRLYALTEELREKNHALAELNLRLRRHTENIEALTKSRQRLETKARIHRELGQALLSSRHYLTEADADPTEILHLWKRSITMLRSAPVGPGLNSPDDHPFDMLLKVAAFAGIRVDIRGPLPTHADSRRLFFEAASEALTNAVNHAGAKTLYICFDETPESTSVRFTNDGDRPAGEIVEGGGLGSLRKKTELLGGYMEICTQPDFTLTLTIPRKAGDHLCTTFSL